MQVLSLVAGGELAGAPIAGTMAGYFGDLFDEGDENGSADLDFEEFARIMQILAPSFEGARATQCVPLPSALVAILLTTRSPSHDDSQTSP